MATRNDKVNGSLPCLPLARRIILTASSTDRQASGAQASATAIERLLSGLSSLVGEAGSAMVLRRSLRLTQGAYPWMDELRSVSPDDLPAAFTASLSQQSQEVAQGASIAVFATLLELFVTLIGERLIMQLLEETWPDVFASSS